MLPIYAKTSNQGFFPSLFNDFFNDSWITPQFHSTSPAINVSEDDKKEDFNVSISDGDIVIAMEKKNENKDENKEKKYIRREFSYSKYEQRLALPDNVEKQNITAQMTDGVLYIDIPKMTPEEKAKECQCIEIK